MESGLKRALEDRIVAGETLTRDDGIALNQCDELAWLGRLAHARRSDVHADRATFSADHPAIDAREIRYGRAETLVDDLLNLREQSPAVLILVREDAAPAETLRTFAVARLLTAKTVHISCDWASHGPALAQLALNFGADDLTGVPADGDESDLLELIWDAGLRPVERDAAFGVISEHPAPMPLSERRAEPQKVWA